MEGNRPKRRKDKYNPYNRCTKDFDSPAGGTVDRGGQRNTDLYADYICGVNGIKTW